jgi:hypothetical protein
MIHIVIIGGMAFTVEEVADLHMFENQNGMAVKKGLWGHITYEDNKIQLEQAMTEQRKHQILIHEIVHGCFNEMGIEKDDEENLVNRLGIILYQVLRDNDFSFIQLKAD